MPKLTHFTITIKSKSYLQKYFSTIGEYPMPLNQSDHLFNTILTKLCNKGNFRVRGKNLNICNAAIKKYQGELTFKIPFDFFYRIEKNPPPALVYNINLYLQQVFEADFCDVVNRATWLGIERRTTIEKFAENHNIIIEEDISYEALKRVDYRYRKNKKKFMEKLSLQKSPFTKPNE